MSKGTGGLVERPTHAKRNAKRREETYGTFISSSSAQSRDPSFACSSRTTLEDVRDEDTALLAKDTVVKPPKPSSALEYLSPSLRLANIGSVARDHLASERTFLSYGGLGGRVVKAASLPFRHQLSMQVTGSTPD